MAYNITLTNGQSLVTIQDGTADTSYTSLTLLGHNFPGYGQFINENFISLLENFSNSSSPNNPLQGQLWWDSTSKVISVWNGVQWKPVSSTSTSSTPPTTPNVGDLWWSTTAAQLNVWNGTGWTIIGPIFTTSEGKTEIVPLSVTDTAGGQHTVLGFYIGGNIVGVMSNDSAFNTTAIPGFTTVNTGINILPTAEYTGTASNAALFSGDTITNFIRSTPLINGAASTLPQSVNTPFTATSLTTNSSLTVGSSGELVLSSTSVSSTINSLGPLNIVLGSTPTINFTPASLLPVSTNRIDLGATTSEFRNVYANNAVISGGITLGSVVSTPPTIQLIGQTVSITGGTNNFNFVSDSTASRIDVPVGLKLSIAGNTLLTVASSGEVRTFSNILDDGTGNLTVAGSEIVDGSLTVLATVNSSADTLMVHQSSTNNAVTIVSNNTTQIGKMRFVDSSAVTEKMAIMCDSAGDLIITSNTSPVFYISPIGKVTTKTNILDDGSGNATFIGSVIVPAATTSNEAVNYGQLASSMSSLGNPLVIIGAWNPATGYPSATPAAGQMWIANAIGSVGGEVYNVGDCIAYGAGSWFKIDGSASQLGNIVSLSGAYTAPVSKSGTYFITSGALVLTLPTPAAGVNFRVYANTIGSVTISPAGGSIYLVDGTVVSTYGIPADSNVAYCDLVADGANWRLFTYGHMVILPATASNEAVRLDQLQNTSLGLTVAGMTTGDAQITGGAINGTPIGATTPSTGSFTTMDATNVSGTLTTAAQPNITSVGTLTGLNVSGTATVGVLSTVDAQITGGAIVNTPISGSTGSFSTIVGTLTTAAQPNITSVGTLTGLNVSGTATVGVLSTVDAQITGGAINGTPIGATTPSTGTFTTMDATNVGGALTTAAQPNITSVGTLTSLNVSGTATVGVLSTVDAQITGGAINGTSIGSTTPSVGTFTTMDATNVGGTLTTAAQPNITSVGTLTSLNVSGTATAANAATSTELVTLGQLNSAISTVTTTAFPGWTDLVLTANVVLTANAIFFPSGFQYGPVSYAAPSFYKDSIGVVHMRGSITANTAATGNLGNVYTISTLPTGYNPKYDFYIPVTNYAGSSFTAFIGADGVISYYTAGTTLGQITFDCVTFQTN